MAEQMNAARPSQAEAVAAAPDREVTNADPKFLELMTKLRAAVTERPDDLEGHLLLARNEAVLGRYDAAATAQANVVRLKGDAAVASDYAEQAGLMILAADGLVTPEAEEVLIRALQLDPRQRRGALLCRVAARSGRTTRPRLPNVARFAGGRCRRRPLERSDPRTNQRRGPRSRRDLCAAAGRPRRAGRAPMTSRRLPR